MENFLSVIFLLRKYLSWSLEKNNYSLFVESIDYPRPITPPCGKISSVAKKAAEKKKAAE